MTPEKPDNGKEPREYREWTLFVRERNRVNGTAIQLVAKKKGETMTAPWLTLEKIDVVEIAKVRELEERIRELESEVKDIVKLYNGCKEANERLDDGWCDAAHKSSVLQSEIAVLREGLESIVSEYAEDVCDENYNPHLNPAFTLASKTLSRADALRSEGKSE